MLSGFDTDIAILLLAASILFSFGLAWWSYSGNINLPPAVKWINVFLRGLAILLLLILLFNPSYEYEETRELKQDIAVLLDNTQSITIEKGDWDGEEEFRRVVRDLNLEDTTAVRYHIFGFDRDLFPTTPDSVPLDGAVTNIHQAISSLGRQDIRADAVVMVTDGIFNRGLDPTNAALQSGLPFYNIAAGDTSRLRDVLVRNVFYNPEAYTNSTIPIRAEIVNDGFPDRTIEVQLYKDDQLIDTRNVNTTASRSVHTEEFEVELTEEGTKSFRVEIPEIGEEWTTANNRYSFTVDVRDDQIRVLHLAFEIHPDVGNLRHILATDESVTFSGLNWISGNRFAGGELPASADTLDLVVLHGFPHPDMPSEARSRVRDLVSETNILLLSLPSTDLENLADHLDNLPPIRQTGGGPRGGILPRVNDDQRDHPVLDLDLPDFERAPELGGPQRNQQGASNARTLLNTTFRGSDTGAPMVSIREIGNTRIAQVNAHHWHLWQQHTNDDYRTFYRNLMNNLVKWASADPGEDILNVQPVRMSFDEGEPIVFRGNVRTETGAPDTEARVDLRITSDDDEVQQDYAMSNLGSGRFSLETRPLPAGTYRYSATAFRGDTELAETSGSFNVTESMLEFLDTIRRDELLKYISENSGGAFFTHDDMDGYFDRLGEDGLLERRTETYSSVIRLHRQIWWFITALLLLTAEWVLRKAFNLA